MTAPLDQATEEELLVRCQGAMARAMAAGPGSLGWSVQWAVYAAAKAELDRRALAWAATASPAGLAGLAAMLRGLRGGWL